MSDETIQAQDTDIQMDGPERGINAEVAIAVGRFLEENFYRHRSREMGVFVNPSSIHIFEGCAVIEVELDWLKELSGGVVIETMEDGRLISHHIEEGPIKLIAIEYNGEPPVADAATTVAWNSMRRIVMAMMTSSSASTARLHQNEGSSHEQQD